MKEILSPHNLAYFNQYKFFLKVEKGLSKNSVEGYLNDLDNFLASFTKNIEEISNKDISIYFLELQEVGLENSSIARKRSSIKSFFTFLQEEEIELILDIENIPKIRMNHNLPDTLSIEETFLFLDAIPTEGALGSRNKAMLELMYASGIRISETINLSIHDINFDKGLIVVMGKGNKQRIVPIAKKSLKYLKQYLNSYRELLRKNKNTENIFLNRSGNKLSRMGIWKIIQKIAKLSMIKAHISPHTFRHSFATHLIQGGANLRIVQLLLGHVSINTTQIYTEVDNQFLKEEHHRCHPRA
ncbi:MAG: site-specific tyrosine recombinase/integron integrase [Candidatus Cloacimonadota bacterium]|nr:site-specific tyrosine recombinase/integron integrase [Candidatus Cloacimonadota bacterium]